MALLTKKQFLSQDDRTYKIVEIPGGEVKIRSLSGEDELEFEQIKQDRKPSEWIFWMIVKGCVDENNEQLFDEESDLELIKKRSSNTIKKLFDEILELNNITTDKIEEEAKN